MWRHSVRQLSTARRQLARRDSERLRHVSDGGFVMPANNPGIRVDPDFVTPEEAAVLTATCEEAAALYGYEYDGETRSHTIGSDGRIEGTSNLVNNVRVTGRL